MISVAIMQINPLPRMQSGEHNETNTSKQNRSPTTSTEQQQHERTFCRLDCLFDLLHCTIQSSLDLVRLFICLSQQPAVQHGIRTYKRRTCTHPKQQKRNNKNNECKMLLRGRTDYVTLPPGRLQHQSRPSALVYPPAGSSPGLAAESSPVAESKTRNTNTETQMRKKNRVTIACST